MPESASIQVKVLFFSVLRERVGTAQRALMVAPGSTGGALLDAIEAAHPSVAPYRSVVRLAVNECYADEDVVLHDGDEVALITPVSGG